jgi:heptosyltransferase-2
MPLESTSTPRVSRVPDVRRLLVLSPNWLGDAVMALSAIDDLRRHHHGSRVIVAARRSVAQLFAMVPWVDEIVELEWKGRAFDPGAMMRDVRRLRALRVDAALLLPNSFAAAWLAFAARVPQRWGYARDGRSFLLTNPIPLPRRVQGDPRRVQGDPAYGDGVPLHQGSYYQHLVHALGAPNGPLEPRLVVADDSVAAARTLLTSAGWDGRRPLVVFAPGAAYGTAKRWWPSHFARLAADLVESAGAHVILIGSAADAATTSEVRGGVPEGLRPLVSDLAGRTRLDVLAGILHLARACVSNDSGAMHVAAAVGVPLAALFGPTRERETAPLAHAPMELLIHDVPCRPCMLRECPIDHPCMRDLDPARVLASVNRMLAGQERAS